jgi:pyruvate dehydrogenase E1 component alpha subunit
MNSTPEANSDKYLGMYRQMARIRAFEDNANQLYLSAKMPGLTHMSSGQEAVAVGVCSAIEEGDKITSTHRGHGHCLAKGAEIKLMFCELLGKVEGYCRGKGGSMHIADQDHGNLGANAIVGAGAGIATGAALSAKRLGTKSVTVCFFGDGALGQGLIYEVMNMAALWKLPIIYACENNLYGEYTKLEEMAAGSLTARAAAFGIEAHVVDGQDVLAVNRIAQQLADRARKGDLSIPRPPRRRHQPRLLSDERGGGVLESRARSDPAVWPLASRREDRQREAVAGDRPEGARRGRGGRRLRLGGALPGVRGSRDACLR